MNIGDHVMFVRVQAAVDRGLPHDVVGVVENVHTIAGKAERIDVSFAGHRLIVGCDTADFVVIDALD